ncbi:MAG: serpin family protein, partial [Firmicutes bacterium]|nr:serpin family protein [Bacillota bacterium]
DITDHLEKLEYCEVNVSIPKFKFEDTEDMVPALTELGITKVFDKSRSSLSEMFDGEKDDIYLDKVKQKAYIDVNENGTEAAAVTEIYAEAAEEFDEEPEIKDFIADRPFTFIIADEYNKEILFMGENAYVQ